MSGGKRVSITIEIDELTAAYLRNLARSSAVPSGNERDVLTYVAHSLADGVRRSGAWERGVVEQLFGEFPEGAPDPRFPSQHLLPWVQPRILEIDLCDDACPECGYAVEAHLADGYWVCLGCAADPANAGLDALEPADVAVAWLLAFALRCFTPRDDRARTEGVVDGAWCSQAGCVSPVRWEYDGWQWCDEHRPLHGDLAACATAAEQREALELPLERAHVARLHDLGEVSAAEGRAISSGRWLGKAAVIEALQTWQRDTFDPAQVAMYRATSCTADEAVKFEAVLGLLEFFARCRTRR